ncbi:hypothetical protein BGX28_003442 [Mortierella sp. GBA30]|nr:hypothetical protein BGX28_003442 [Mortierella sp. GBA30]
MADHSTSTAVPRRTTNAGSRATTGGARPTNSSAVPIRTSINNRTARPTTIASTATAVTGTPTPSATAENASGPSGAMLGGIAAGVVLLFGLVGVLFYKKRKRAAVAAAEMSSKSKKGGMSISGADAPISGPLALAPEKGIDAAPAHRPEAKFREQQQFRPGMRDELFAQPGSTLHTTLSNKNKRNNNNINNSNSNIGDYKSNGGEGGDSVNRNNSNKNHGQEEKPKDRSSPSDGYYDDEHLVHDYYGGAESLGTIGAQRPTPHPRDHSHGNLTPAPDYYLGKEDIDPRRDLRGLDSPETYVKKTAAVGSSPLADPRQIQQLAGNPQDSPRSSYSSGRDSAYMTIEQAQQAHNQKMRGPKDSIYSVDMLHLDTSSPPKTQERVVNRPPDYALSMAMSESTMSVMPSLPPVGSPMPFNGGHQHSQYDPRMQQPQRHGGGRPSPPGPGPGPFSPLSIIATEDPYAESAYSDELRDDRSMVSAGYNHPKHRQQQQHYQGSGRGGPHSPGPMSPPYSPYQQPQQQGYNNRPQQPPRGNNGGGYGPYRPGPGPGPGPQQDYNEGPYQRQY